MLAVQASTAHPDPSGPQRRDTREILAALLSELPEPYSVVLGLVELEEASFAEAATILGLSPASLRLLYTEGRRRLRDVVIAHTETGNI